MFQRTDIHFHLSRFEMLTTHNTILDWVFVNIVIFILGVILSVGGQFHMIGAIKDRFIVIDGIDGSGKGLQTDLLVERLKKDNVKTLKLSFPSYEETVGGKLLKDLLKNLHFLKVDPRLASLPYALDRRELREKIKKYFFKNYLIVSDRYVSANQIHQGGKYNNLEERRNFIEWLDFLEYELLEVVRPDICIVIDVPVDIAVSLLKKENKALNIVEQDIEYLENSRQCALWLARRGGCDLCTYRLIEATRGGVLRSPEDIAEEIWRIVRPRI